MPSSRDLPPLSALRVFEAAARHLSFTRAAAELGMTQAAVSYQIRVLEDRVGASLFVRGNRQLALTQAGAALSGPASESMDLLAAGYAAARGSVSGTLTLDVVPSFATCWLARHLGEFRRTCPKLAVQVISSTRMADFSRDEIDCAVRWGSGAWPNLSCHPLFDVSFTPMLSPDALARIGGLATPADLRRAPLVDPSDPWWDDWFRGAGVERPAVSDRIATGLKGQHLGAVAAVAGQGVALLTPLFWREELAKGRLVRPFDIVCGDGRAYWFCYPTNRRNVSKISLFRAWLLDRFPYERSPV